MAARKGQPFGTDYQSVSHVKLALRSTPCAIRLTEASRPTQQKMTMALKEESPDRVWTAAGISASEIMLMFIPPVLILNCIR